MSRRAYRINKVELNEIPSFNLSENYELELFLLNHPEVEEAGSELIVPVKVVEDIILWGIAMPQMKVSEEVINNLKADVVWAKENDKEYLYYDCF